MLRWSRAALLVAALVLTAACGPSYIGDTRIEDTPETREIAEMVEAYRAAMEARDVEALAELVSLSYFENASTTALSGDDYGVERLREHILPLLQDNIKAVQYRLRLTRIEVRGDRAHADFEFWLKFLFTEGGKEGWHVKNDFNRLTFEREENGWKIVAGL